MIMEYKDFIKAGAKVIHAPYDGWTEVVTIGEYRPYRTDGSADPTPDEYDELCYVECEGTDYGKQLQLADLFPIMPCEDDLLAYYDGQECRIIGHNDDIECWVIDCHDELIVVGSDDLMHARDIWSLNYDEAKQLRAEIVLDSFYSSDYDNSLGVDNDIVMNVCFNYMAAIDEYYCCGEDETFKHDSPELFADYICSTGIFK